MIKLQRVRTKQAITAGLRGPKRVEKAVLLIEGRLAHGDRQEFKSDFWKAAKKQLKVETNGKCAYCEAPVKAVAHGDVEHFRPKSVYWWLAYCYDNYLFSCQICNQSFKGDKFPLEGTAMALDPPLPSKMTPAQVKALAQRLAPDPLVDAEGFPAADFAKLSDKEKCGLIDPYVVDPEPLFKWVADPVLKEVALAPRNNKAATRRAFKAAEEALGLNRPELKGERWKVYKILETFKKSLLSAQAGGNDDLADEIEAQIRDMLSDGSEYAGMARYFVRVEWDDELGDFNF
ncbi:MAG TPA: hypothetical protein VG148_06635 [Pyrinomonadaceae bacterium]|nr:hypothetical protein [Pyrinomonadaceae bacterium]